MKQRSWEEKERKMTVVLLAVEDLRASRERDGGVKRNALGSLSAGTTLGSQDNHTTNIHKHILSTTHKHERPEPLLHPPRVH